MKKYIVLPILAASAVSANAAIVTILGTTADSQFNGAVPGANTSNSLGLSANPTTDSQLLSVTHDEASDARRQWHTAIGVTANTAITYTVGGVASGGNGIGSIWIWQANQTSLFGRGVNQFDILISTDDGATYTEVSANQNLAISAGGNINAQGFDLNESNVTNVRLRIDSNHGDPSVVGLSEVRFSSSSVADVNATVVPEPSASTLLGLGGLALILRRRK